MSEWTTDRKHGQTIPSMPEDGIATITSEQRAAARRTVAENALDADDAAQLLLMLGVFPGQESDDFTIPDTFMQTEWCQ